MSGSEQIKAFLHDRDEPCPLCGYNLRNLAEEQCPECGARLTLSLRGAHALDAVWHGVIGFFGVVGVVMLLNGVAILSGLMRGGGFPARPGLGVAFVVLAFLGPVFAMAVNFSRRRLLRDLKGRTLLVALPLCYLAAILILLLLL